MSMNDVLAGRPQFLYILRRKAAYSINFSADKLLQSIFPESDAALGNTNRKRPDGTDYEDFATNLFERRS